MIRLNKWALSALAVLVACSSNQKESEISDTKSGAHSTAQGQPSSEKSPMPLDDAQILEKYSLLELNSAATALVAIFDQSLAGSKEKVLSCKISGDEARRWTMPLKYLIDQQTAALKKQYIDNPNLFAKEFGFETCAASCSCGVLASLLEPIEPSSVRRIEPRLHERYLLKLQAKASRQEPEMSLRCAQKQEWFCTSDLKSYLASESRE